MKKLALFDVDGTLTLPRKAASPDMLVFMQQLRREGNVDVGIVGGSDLSKIAEQLSGGDVDALLDAYDYVFAENGLVAYRGRTLLGEASIRDFLGEGRLHAIINFALRYVADLVLPVKRGTFVEFRKGMLNVSPIGRNCSQSERDAFEAYDNIHHIRAQFIATLKDAFPDLGLTYSIGGQISFDVFPSGWDKTYCLQFVEALYPPGGICFFGDKTHPGGNDHEIFEDPRTQGITVTGPDHTRDVCQSMFMSYTNAGMLQCSKAP